MEAGAAAGLRERVLRRPRLCVSVLLAARPA